MTINVDVCGTSVEVEYSVQLDGQWMTTGTYLGKRIEVKADSRSSALEKWRRTAEHRGS